MDLLERYLYEVGRRLPANQREDIINELRSSLMDALDARAAGREPTEEDVAAVLREFGKPEDVAARYIGEKYVIGPRLYPTYKLVLTIVAAALAFGLFVSMAVGYAFGPQPSNLAGGFFQFLGSLFSGLLSAIGSVTIIFWAIDRGLTRQGAAGLEDGEAWNPKSLPPVPIHQDAWKPSESIVAIVFAIIALVLFNAFPDLISIYAQDAAGQWQHFPILAEDALRAYLPYWNIGWAFAIALHAVLLAQGRWRLGTNLAHIGVQVYNIVVLGVMIAGPKLLNTAGAFMISADATETFSKVVSMVNAQFHWILILAIIGSAVDIGKTVYRVVRDRP